MVQDYVLEMSDGTTMTITALDMKQKFGFLVFTDSGASETVGVRAEDVKVWRIQPHAVKAAQIKRTR